MPETTTVKGKECLITLVCPGKSDCCIKVFPAEHASKKIWLDNTPGKERWEMISRMIQLHASRFSPIPAPTPWHEDPKDLKSITMKPEEIPLVKLEHFVLPAPPAEPQPVDQDADKTDATRPPRCDFQLALRPRPGRHSTRVRHNRTRW